MDRECFLKLFLYNEQSTQNLSGEGESDRLRKNIATASNDVDTMWFMPSALNVKVMKFKHARVNGRSNNHSLMVAKCLVI